MTGWAGSARVTTPCRTSLTGADFASAPFLRQTCSRWISEGQFKPEARKGDPEASYWLGVMFENGTGTKKDIDRALTWYRKSAEAGLVKAILKMGELYMQGTDVLQDFDEARKWLEPAAREGDVDAMRDMGTLYAHGWGVKQNAIRAYIWFDYAASRGDPRSESRVSTGSKA